jgi:hypothetical protein
VVPLAAVSVPAGEAEEKYSGRGDVYYTGTSSKELGTLVLRALDQLTEFRQVKMQNGDGDVIGAGFDDSRLIIECKPSSTVDRLCVSVIFGCKDSVDASDVRLLRLVNDLNAKYNTASFSVLTVGTTTVLQVQGSLCYINHLQKDMILAWFEHFETATDAVATIERDRLKEFLE